MISRDEMIEGKTFKLRVCRSELMTGKKPVDIFSNYPIVLNQWTRDQYPVVPKGEFDYVATYKCFWMSPHPYLMKYEDNHLWTPESGWCKELNRGSLYKTGFRPPTIMEFLAFAKSYGYDFGYQVLSLNQDYRENGLEITMCHYYPSDGPKLSIDTTNHDTRICENWVLGVKQ